jgi:hypothetical protein
MDRQAFVAKLDTLIEWLSKPLTAEDTRHGWRDQSRSAILNLVEEMRADALRGRELRSVPHYVGVVRGLDHWGISGGDLFDAVAAIGALARGM